MIVQAVIDWGLAISKWELQGVIRQGRMRHSGSGVAS